MQFHIFYSYLIEDIYHEIFYLADNEFYKQLNHLTKVFPGVASVVCFFNKPVETILKTSSKSTCIKGAGVQ